MREFAQTTRLDDDGLCVDKRANFRVVPNMSVSESLIGRSVKQWNRS
jgi:hypothetical protein